jgi:DnaJ-class molecular chaperone
VDGDAGRNAVAPGIPSGAGGEAQEARRLRGEWIECRPLQSPGRQQGRSQEDIQKAYRKLAKKLHPDLNPGNKTAEENFKQVSAAYDLLGDPEKRARFDRGEIDESGAERPRQRYYRDFADDMAGTHAYSSDAGFADFEGEDILSEIFGRSAGARATRPRRGFDIRYTLPVDFLDAVNGATRQVRLADGPSSR